jgi:hypothetical protein
MNCNIQSPTMFARSPALQLLLMMFAGWVKRHQLRIIEYLKEENRVLAWVTGRFTSPMRRDVGWRERPRCWGGRFFVN